MKEELNNSSTKHLRISNNLNKNTEKNIHKYSFESCSKYNNNKYYEVKLDENEPPSINDSKLNEKLKKVKPKLLFKEEIEDRIKNLNNRTHLKIRALNQKQQIEPIKKNEVLLGNKRESTNNKTYSENFTIYKNVSCIICMSNISTFKHNFSLKCGHSYHKNCINYWIKTKPFCPICNDNNYHMQLKDTSIKELIEIVRYQKENYICYNSVIVVCILLFFLLMFIYQHCSFDFSKNSNRILEGSY